MNLREYMIVFWKQQDAVFHQAEASHSAPLVDWIGRLTTKEDVEKDIKENIDKLARAVKGLEDLNDDSFHTHFNNAFAEQDFRETNEVQSLSDRLSVLGFYEELFTTGLHSDYITHVAVMELIRKTDVLRSNFSLCVVTADRVLHLFTLNQKVETPEEAFALILERDNQEDKDYRLRPDESFAAESMEVVTSPTGNKVDIRTNGVRLSLLATTRKELMTLLNAIGTHEPGENSKSNLSLMTY